MKTEHDKTLDAYIKSSNIIGMQNLRWFLLHNGLCTSKVLVILDELIEACKKVDSNAEMNVQKAIFNMIRQFDIE